MTIIELHVFVLYVYKLDHPNDEVTDREIWEQEHSNPVLLVQKWCWERIVFQSDTRLSWLQLHTSSKLTFPQNPLRIWCITANGIFMHMYIMIFSCTQSPVRLCAIILSHSHTLMHTHTLVQVQVLIHWQAFPLAIIVWGSIQDARALIQDLLWLDLVFNKLSSFIWWLH